MFQPKEKEQYHTLDLRSEEDEDFEEYENIHLREKIEDQKDKIEYLEATVEGLREDKDELRDRNKELREHLGDLIQSQDQNLTMFSLVGAGSCGIIGIYGLFVMNLTYILFGVGLAATFLTGYQNVRKRETDI